MYNQNIVTFEIRLGHLYRFVPVVLWREKVKMRVLVIQVVATEYTHTICKGDRYDVFTDIEKQVEWLSRLYEMCNCGDPSRHELFFKMMPDY